MTPGPGVPCRGHGVLRAPACPPRCTSHLHRAWSPAGRSCLPHTRQSSAWTLELLPRRVRMDEAALCAHGFSAVAWDRVQACGPRVWLHMELPPPRPRCLLSRGSRVLLALQCRLLHVPWRLVGFNLCPPMTCAVARGRSSPVTDLGPLPSFTLAVGFVSGRSELNVGGQCPPSPCRVGLLLGRGLVSWPGVCGWVRPGSAPSGTLPQVLTCLVSAAASPHAARRVLGTWSPEGSLPQPRAHWSLTSPAPGLVRAQLSSAHGESAKSAFQGPRLSPCVGGT